MYSLWQRINNKTVDTDTSARRYVELKVVSETKLIATFLSNNKIIEEKILRGKYGKGYFILKSRYKASFKFGPLLWGLAGFKIFLGVTRENNLILLESNGGTAMFFLLPIFPASEHHFLEYKRITD